MRRGVKIFRQQSVSNVSYPLSSTVGGFAELEEIRDLRVPLLRLRVLRTGPGEVWHQDVLRAESGGQVSHSQRGLCLVLHYDHVLPRV